MGGLEGEAERKIERKRQLFPNWRKKSFGG